MLSRLNYILVIVLFIGLHQDVSGANECASRGRFANEEAEECRGYTICLMGGITNFTQYKLSCPQGTVYSHIEQQCTNATSYKCYPNFNCTGVGNLKHEESKDCSWYIACFEGIDGIATARLIQCALDTSFNDIEGICVNKTEHSCLSPVNHGVDVNVHFITLFVVSLITNLLK